MSEVTDVRWTSGVVGQPPPPRPEDRIPDRCPDCGAVLLTIENVMICPSCGFRGDHPLAGRIREIDVQLARLASERGDVINRIRRDRGILPPTPRPPPSMIQPSPATPRRSLSIQAVLVALGAFLVVVASVIFAVVTWEQLGATGQALVLMVATATAAGATVAAARARLTATAEALAVVAAGLAFLDVHAARIAVAPDDPWQIAWAVGIGVVAVGLLAFGRAVGLRGPAIVAVTAGQLPLVFLASLAEQSGLAVAAALVVTAALDLIATRRVEATPREWLPDPASLLLALFGALAWATGVVVATSWALAGETAGSRWWAVGVLAAATAVSATVSWRARTGEPLAIAAAAGTVLAGLLVVLGTGRQVIDDDNAVLLLSNASAVAVLAASCAAWGTVRRKAPPGSDVDARSTDPRLVAGTVVAAAWAGLSLLSWAGPVLGAILAPLAVLTDDGWWSHGLSLTTGELDLDPLPGQAENVDAPSAGLVLAAVAVGTAGMVTAIRLVRRRPSTMRRTATELAVGVGLFSAIAVIGAGWNVPVVALVVVYLLGAVVPPAEALRSELHDGSWLAVGALPIAASAVVWAGLVEGLTVTTFGALTVLGALVVARGVAKQRRALTGATTAMTGTALAVTALTIGLALGVADSTAWILAIAAGAAGSSAAWIGDRWVPWWSPAIDLTSTAVVGVAVAGLALAGGPDPLSVGLLIVVVAATVHATRPTRRAAAILAASAALVLWWLRAWTADLHVVEVYSLPAAALAGSLGWWQLRRRPDRGSWPTLGPALLIAAIPSVAVAVSEPGVLRPLLVLVVATVATIAGARLRLRAPFALGVVTAVIIAVDQLFPTVARLPRWTVIGTVGILLLLVGATFERQRRRVAGLYERYRQLR